MKKKILPVLIVLLLIFLLGGSMVGSFLIKRYTPTKERKDLSLYFDLTSADQAALILNEEKQSSIGRFIDGNYYVDYAFAHDNLNARFYWDETENLLLYAQPEELLQAKADADDRVRLIEGTPYINIAYLSQFSDFNYQLFENPYRIVIQNAWGAYEMATPTGKTEIRVLGGIKSPILRDVSSSDELYVLSRDQKWTKVMSMDGLIGYIRSAKLSSGQTVELASASSYTEPEYSHLLMDEPVSMLWHQVTNRTSNQSVTSVLATASNINVISPTWFYLNDNEGNIADLSSRDYVSSCHNKGIRVWALVSNLENGDVDSATVLRSTSARTRLISNLISAAHTAGFDGINVDFESLGAESTGDAFIEFIRELSVQCRLNQLVLSVDNYSPYNYNEFYNRKEQALFADYVVLMAYDEHYSGSEDGPVASLPWVRRGIEATLERVPAEQLILGNPFYTRLWSVTPKNPDVVPADATRMEANHISSSIYGMQGAAELLASKGVSPEFDSENGLNFASWTEDTTTYEIWLEDDSAVAARIDLMNEYRLAGAAFWKSGFETSATWNVISGHLYP